MKRTTPKLSDTLNEFGCYEIRWSEETPKGWRSKRKSTRTADLERAEMELAAFLNNRGEKPDVAVRHIVDDVLDAYLEKHARPRGNWASDNKNLRAVRLAFGARKPHTIHQNDIDDYIAARERGEYGRRPVTLATARRELISLQAALNYGSRQMMILGRPTFAFDKPPVAPGRDLWLTEEQEQEVRSALHRSSRSVQLFVLMGLSFGARSGAMMDLRFGPQVSFISGAIDFNVPGKRRTRKRRPVSPMIPEVRTVLEILFQQRGSGAFVLDRETPREMRRFMESIGFGWVTPHVLKHSAISLMLRGGAKEVDVAKATATDPETIRRVYRHHTIDELAATVLTRRK